MVNWWKKILNAKNIKKLKHNFSDTWINIKKDFNDTLVTQDFECTWPDKKTFNLICLNNHEKEYKLNIVK